jgi:hypothetical protein
MKSKHFIDGERKRATVKFTERGSEKVKNNGQTSWLMKYIVILVICNLPVLDLN